MTVDLLCSDSRGLEKRTLESRHIGLEQELFLVDEDCIISNRADEFLARCGELAKAEGRDPEHFAPECVKSLVEVSTPPAASVEELSGEYLYSLRLAIRAGQDLGLRLYPLATYPLPLEPDVRDELHYRIQSQTVGRERFLHAGRCAGVHLHLEVASGTVDSRIGVSYSAPPAAREELLDLYNLVTALDPAIIALTRSSSFYEGELLEVTARTAFYRGSPDFAPHGLYAKLEALGGLLPYARDAGELIQQQFTRYQEWLLAMDRAGVARRLFEEAGDGMLDAAWNPVRLNTHDTVELRGIDGNYPAVVLDVTSLIAGAAGRIRSEGLTVKPTDGVRTFEIDGHYLRVPEFEYVGRELFRAAATAGAESLEVSAYLDSIFEFLGEEADGLKSLRSSAGYRNTEAEILESLRETPDLSQEAGLRLVREACDELERQVSTLCERDVAETTKVGTNGE